MRKIFAFLAVLAVLIAEPLPVNEAFRPSISGDSVQGVTAKIAIDSGVFLYADKVRLYIGDRDITEFLNIPASEQKGDYKVFRNEIELFAPSGLLSSVATEFANGADIALEYLGCADDGFCYQPMRAQWSVEFDTAGKLKINSELIAGVDSSDGASGGAKTPSPVDDGGFIDSILSPQNANQSAFSGSAWLVLITFFGYGIALSLTPCVWPMVPIISALIVARAKGAKSEGSFLTSLIYVLAMSVAYAIAGVIAAAAGASVQGILQSPAVVLVVAAIFVLLALPMFGVGSLELSPKISAWLEGKIAGKSGLVGVAAMGAVSALIVGPCVAAPMAAALLYIANSGDMVLGGLSLFIMSVGMGVPLLAIGLGAKSWLPKAGAWMNGVKTLFGFVMLALAAWLVARVFGDDVGLVLYAVLGVIFAVVFGVFESAVNKAFRGVLMAIFIASAAVLASSTAKMVLGFNSVATVAHEEIVVTSLDEIDKITDKNERVVLDFWASWCANCKDLDRLLASKEIKNELKNWQLVKVDVSKMGDSELAAMKRFNIFGPPALVFYKNGKTDGEHIIGVPTKQALIDRLRHD